MEKNVFMKIVPLAKRHFHHKKGIGSEGFVFLCRRDTYLRYRSTCWITQLVRSRYWLASAFPERTASSPVRPYSYTTNYARGSMLSLSPKRKNLYTEESTSFLPIYLSSLSDNAYNGGSYQNTDGRQESKQSPQVVIVVLEIHAHSSDTVHFVLYWNQLVIAPHNQKFQLLGWNYFFSIQIERIQWFS